MMTVEIELRVNGKMVEPNAELLQSLMCLLQLLPESQPPPVPWHDVGSPDEQTKRFSAPTTKSLTLEYGKRYRSREGKEYGPLVESLAGPDGEYPFYDRNRGEAWRLDGTWSNREPDGTVPQYGRDLIEEVKT